MTCGSTVAWVSACGRSYRPPSRWQSLWCSDMVVAPRQIPHSQAPYWAVAPAWPP